MIRGIEDETCRNYTDYLDELRSVEALKDNENGAKKF